MPGEYVNHWLITLPVRGHHIAPDPRAQPIPDWEGRPADQQARPNRSFLDQSQRAMAGAVLANRCAARGGDVVEVAAGRTFLHALVRLSGSISPYGLADAVVRVSARRARKDGWREGARLFGVRHRIDRIEPADVDAVVAVLKSIKRQ